MAVAEYYKMYTIKRLLNCVHMRSFADLIRRTPPPTFSDTAITDRHSDTTNSPAQSSLGADILVYWIGKIVRTCAPGGSRTLDFLLARRAPYPLGQALRKTLLAQRGRTHGAGCVRQWFRTAEPLGERRYENWNTHTHTHTAIEFIL